MSGDDSRGRYIPKPTPVPEKDSPVSCPSCQSSKIATTAKNPGVDSYWRCASCGEVWNASRHHPPRRGGSQWR